MSFKVNIKANVEAMAGDSKYQDIPENDTIIWRFAPPQREDGMLFHPTKNHYKLVNPDEPARTMALADLATHGNDTTGYVDYIATLSSVLIEHGNDSEKKIGKMIKGNFRYYSQGWKCVDLEQNTWSKLRFLALPKTPSNAILKILDNQDKMGTPSAVDPVRGQALMISREGSGFNTKYTVDRSGKEESLDDIIPGWEKTVHTDLYPNLDLNVFHPDKQKSIAKLTFPKLDWDKLEAEYGL